MTAQTGTSGQDDVALSHYFQACHARVASFVDTHFAYPGAWATNRPAFGLDLLRAPLNLAWAPIYVLCQILAAVAGWGRADRVAARLRETPPGLRTDVQRYVEGHIEEDLLRLGQPDPVEVPEDLRREALKHYGSARTATADIGNSVASTLVGAFALKAFTPGGIAIGLFFGAHLAHRRASDDFWLGSYLGDLRYGLVPADPTSSELAIGVVSTLAVLAAIASLSALILDPLQRRLGLHQRRLHRLLDTLERDVRERTGSRYRPRDPFLARLLDAVDAARGTLPLG